MHMAKAMLREIVSSSVTEAMAVEDGVVEDVLHVTKTLLREMVVVAVMVAVAVAVAVMLEDVVEEEDVVVEVKFHSMALHHFMFTYLYLPLCGFAVFFG